MDSLIYESNIVIVLVACLLIFWQLFALFADFCERKFRTLDTKIELKATCFWVSFMAFPMIVTLCFPSIKLDVLLVWTMLSVEATVLTNSNAALAIRRIYFPSKMELGSKWIRLCIFLILVPLLVFLLEQSNKTVLITLIYVVFFVSIERLTVFFDKPSDC